MKKLLRNTLRSSWFQRAVGVLAAEYLRLVWNTTRFAIEPAGIYEQFEREAPVILRWNDTHHLEDLA